MIIENQRVINARLEDAVFFWNRDKKKNFNDYFEKLNKVIFHNELGTIQDKVLRLKNSPNICQLNLQTSFNIKLISIIQFRIIKKRFNSELVKEFPELQGIMGAYYAKKENLIIMYVKLFMNNINLWALMISCLKLNLGKIVSLIDKMDTLVRFFIIGKKPTSSKIHLL